jgi:hypothetical protein
VRGQAYLQSGKPTEALAEFQSLLVQHYNLGNSPIKPAAHVDLARAYTVAGDSATAVIHTDLQCHLLDHKTKDSQYAVTCSSIAGVSRRS